ncbi:MAG: hypothetical protein KAS32_22690 [Candidatus Peribacteraceae bacterium]|nr:hypothetical protein [Candidatus Peribacteraceae bacterium]
MPRYIYHAREYKLDRQKLYGQTRKNTHEKMRRAAGIFLREVITHVPVWTGEAMGSLAPIAHELHVRIPTSKSSTAPYDGFALGVTQANTSKPFINQKNYIFSFSIGTDVPHFLLNDSVDVSKHGILLKNPTPWNAFEQGANVALSYLRLTGYMVIPNFSNFIILKNVVNYA